MDEEGPQSYEEYGAYELMGREAWGEMRFFVPNACLFCEHSRNALHAVSEATPERTDYRDLRVSEFYDILDSAGYDFACEYQFGEVTCRELTIGV